MHTPDERRSWIADVLHGLDTAAANLDRAIDALTETAAPGRAYRLGASSVDAP